MKSFRLSVLVCPKCTMLLPMITSCFAPPESEEQRTSLSNMRVHQRTYTPRSLEGRAQSVGTSYFQSIRESPQFIIRGSDRNHSTRLLTRKAIPILNIERLWFHSGCKLSIGSFFNMTDESPSPDRRAASRHCRQKER